MIKKLTTSGIAFLIIICVLSVSCGSKSPADFIPEDAKAAIVIPNLGKTAADMEQFVDWLSKQIPELAQRKMQLMAAGEQKSFETMITDYGLDPKRGAAFALIDPNANKFAAIVPISNEETFLATIKNNVLRGQEFTKNDGVYTLPMGVMIIKKGYALIASDTATVKKLGSGKSISKNEGFSLVSKKLGGGDLFLYIPTELIRAAQDPQDEQLAKIMENLKAIGANLDLSGEGISLKVFAPMDGMGVVKKILSSTGKNSLLSTLPGPAPIMAKINLNIAELWEVIKTAANAADQKTKGQYELIVAQSKVALGMDLETDIIANLVGDPVIAYYGMGGKRKKDPMFVFTIEVNDEAKIKQALEKIAEVMLKGRKPRKGDLDAMGVIELRIDSRDKLYAAVAKKNLILSTDPESMKKVLAVFTGTASGPSAFASIKYEEAKKMLQDKALSVVYVGTEQMAQDLKEETPRQQQARVKSYMRKMPIDNPMAKSLFGGIMGSAPNLKIPYMTITINPDSSGMLAEFNVKFSK